VEDSTATSDPWDDLETLPAQATDAERALARRLRSLNSDDPQIAELLIDHYAPDIYRLVYALLDGPGDSFKDSESRSSDIQRIVQHVFVEATSSFDRFEGEESLRAWLCRIAVNSALAYRRRKNRWRWLTGVRASPSQEKHEHESSAPRTGVERQVWATVDGLAEKERLCVILRYLSNLSVPEIAHVLGVSVNQAHTKLNAARQTIQHRVADASAPPDLGETGRHPEIRRQIQASLDGLLDSALETKECLDEHLSTCSECQSYAQEQSQTVSRLAEALQARWSTRALTPPDVAQLVATVESQLVKTKRSERLLNQFRELGLYGFVILAILAVVWHLGRTDTHEGEPLFPPTPPPPPTPVQASAGMVRDVSGQDEGPTDTPLRVTMYTDPAISADGRTVAYVSSDVSTVTGDTEGSADVFVFDRQTGVLEHASVDSRGERGNGLSFGSMVSADGRFVVFASSAGNLVAGDNQICDWEDGQDSNCLDIFCHDRETGSTQRVSAGYDGDEADGHSFFPTISADGRWVAFWSAASNLVKGDTAVCGEGEEARSCLDVFVHDRETETTDWIPVGWSGGPEAGNRLLSISEDGRYVTVVLHTGDLAAAEIDLANEADLFVYDRHSDTFEPVNVSRRGTPGDQPSISGIISADGRYVVFVSRASNLVAGDTNEQADVFVRDRAARTTERVSVASDGRQGNGESGTLAPLGPEGWGFQIGISDGGRLVAFMSFADNLVGGQANAQGPWGDCNNVYIHDRRTGQTQSVTGGPEGGCLYSHLHMSGDGRWIALIEQLPNCSPGSVCSELWLHDWRAGLTENLLRDGRSGAASGPNLTLGHDRAVNTVAFSPDGRTVASGANDGILRIWRVRDGALLQTMEGHTRPVSDIAFFQDGTLLVSGSLDRTVNVWRVSDGALLRRLAEGAGEVLSLAVSPDDRLLALGSHGAAWIWEADGDSFTRVASQEYPGSYVSSLAFSPDGDLLALALSDGTVWLRRTLDGETVHRLGGHTGKVLSLAFSPDGRYLATGSEDHSLNLWQMRAEPDGRVAVEHILTLQHPDWVRALAFSPDSALLATGAFDRNTRLWRVPDGKLLDPPMHTWHQVLDVAFSPDGHTLALGTVGGNLHLWHVAETEDNSRGDTNSDTNTRTP
jgi:RNA polymerase sigma factor (sigma-70 family)